MVDDRFSCIKEVTKSVHIALPTACTSNEISGICDVLESWKRQYIQQLQGIVVSYKNVSLSSVRGYIKLDCPVVHYDVKATFELFYPTAGSILKGKINRVSHDHIGCLVHNTINVTLDQPQETLGDISNFIILDRVILFQITRLDFKRKIIRVRGKITRECIDLMKELDEFSSQNENLNCVPPEFNARGLKRFRKDSEISNDLDGEELTSDSSRSSPKKKKFKKSLSASPEKNICVVSQDPSSIFESSTDTSSHVTSSKRKKKHKKSKNDVLSSPPLFNESLESSVNEIRPMQPQQNEFSSKSDFNQNASSPTSDEKEIFSDVTGIISSPFKCPLKQTVEEIKEESTKNQEINNNTLDNSFSVFKAHDFATPQTSSSKNKKTKKSKENSSKSPSSSSSNKKKKAKDKSDNSPKEKQKKSKSKKTPRKEKIKNNVTSSDIKKEIDTDSSSSRSPSESKKTSGNFKDVYEMMAALSSFEPPPEAQLLGDFSLSEVKKEIAPDSAKKGKKRKRDSVGTSSLPTKKQKNNDGSSSSKSKDKKKKDKSKKDSKKEKKKKPKNKVISSKKKGHGSKIKLKKGKKQKKR